MAGKTRSIDCVCRDGSHVTVPVRECLHYSDPDARYTGYKPEKLLLKKGSIRLEGYMPLPCDIVLERDVPVRLRDGVTIYTDVFLPADDEEHPAIMALSPYGKEIGSQWLDDTRDHAGIPKDATSGLQKFEGPDPAYWCNHGYAIVNPDVRGAYRSEGVIRFFGSQYGRDGADICEWAAAQPWCNGRVAMSGNSWLAISQWFVAAEHPEHLAAIAPWEGLSDCYNEVATRGGVPMPEFVKAMSDSFATTEDGGVENVVSCMREHPTWDSYWDDKRADLESITVPAYVVASYTNPIHVYGSLEGFRLISSEEKWLRIHNTGEWDDYYNPAHTEDLRRFFDHYLKGEDNGWETTPHVRYSVLDPGGADSVDRTAASWPLPGTRYERLHLDNAVMRLTTESPVEDRTATYNSDSRGGKLTYRFRVPRDMECVGYWKLRVWVEAPDAGDMDLKVTVQKRRPNGFKYSYATGPGMDMAAFGYQRVSLRELDQAHSEEWNPKYTFAHPQKLKAGEVVPVDILIWPMGIRFRKGEMLYLTISAYKTRKIWTGPFKLKMAKIELPVEGFTYMPGEKGETYTIGGGEMMGGSVKTDDSDMPHDSNRGRHVVHAGGACDSYLLVPVLDR